jgi:anti-sigma factor ChrR (cupin superfamily)
MNSTRDPDQDHIHELASLYALDALQGPERAAYEEHVRHCTQCQSDVRSFSEVVGVLGESVQAAPPPPLRRRLLDRVGGAPRRPGVLLQQTGLLISRSSELAWREMAPGIVYKPLFEDLDRNYNTSLIRMEAGAHYPGHRHSGIEELFLLSGDLSVEGQVMRTGDYCRADSGTIHGETFTDGGCLFLLMASQLNELLA